MIFMIQRNAWQPAVAVARHCPMLRFMWSPAGYLAPWLSRHLLLCLLNLSFATPGRDSSETGRIHPLVLRVVLHCGRHIHRRLPAAMEASRPAAIFLPVGRLQTSAPKTRAPRQSATARCAHWQRRSRPSLPLRQRCCSTKPSTAVRTEASRPTARPRLPHRHHSAIPARAGTRHAGRAARRAAWRPPELTRLHVPRVHICSELAVLRDDVPPSCCAHLLHSKVYTQGESP